MNAINFWKYNPRNKKRLYFTDAPKEIRNDLFNYLRAQDKFKSACLLGCKHKKVTEWKDESGLSEKWKISKKNQIQIKTCLICGAGLGKRRFCNFCLEPIEGKEYYTDEINQPFCNKKCRIKQEYCELFLHV